ncbi:hypothetical protein O181_020240 [Austropuccinia psidii MF-1]|uniref:Uncharacterized protein n=1 Tax=Austropuccinia psidii MF-1 TaxID=1389203 RepID=A0A9Q3CDD6_9BASI|nr:hypothetical protein [Austropuccinia psidii MF-1]
MTQYQKLFEEYGAIIPYLQRYQYIQGDINHNEELWERLSTSFKELLEKEMIKDRAMVQALDGEKETRFEDETYDEFPKQVKELTHKIKNTPQTEPQPRNAGEKSVKEVSNQIRNISEAFNPPRRNWNNYQKQIFSQKNKTYRPRNPLPPFSSSYQPYIPAQMSARPPLIFDYFKEEGPSTTRCTHLAKDLDKRIVRSQGYSYLFPNYQGVPMEGNDSSKEIVRAFSKEKNSSTKNL